MNKGSIKEVDWQAARAVFADKNPTLCKIIDELNPGKEYTFFRCRYPYGTKIIDEGTISLPNAAGDIVPASDTSIPQTIRDKLSYSWIPMAFISENSSEIYFELEGRLVSVFFLPPGIIFGLWETLDPSNSYLSKRMWSGYSGARSIVMLPKIADVASHRNLQRKYGVKIAAPKTLLDQGKVFAQIAGSPNFEEEWFCEVYFFSAKWIERKEQSPAWLRFREFLLQTGWDQSQYWRNKVTFDLIWELFILELAKQNIKSNAYLIQIVKHLALIGTGVLPGLTPAGDIKEAGPMQGLQKVYTEDYGAKEYVPTLMVPYHLTTNKPGKYAYYSLHFPMLLESLPKNRLDQSAITILREIRDLECKFQEEAIRGKLRVEGTPIFDFVQNINCDYFHSESDMDNGIFSSKQMPQNDKNLLHSPYKGEKRRFSENCQFVRGCIRLSFNKPNQA